MSDNKGIKAAAAEVKAMATPRGGWRRPFSVLGRVLCWSFGHRRPLGVTHPSWAEGSGWCGRCGSMVLGGDT